MQDLRLVGVDDSGGRLLLSGPDGKQYSVLLDDRLRAAARSDRTHLGQLEIELEGAPRPRDIQARIRAGASVEDVADEAGLPVDRVERFARPVLAERDHLAETARSCPPRRGADPSTTSLGVLVEDRLAARGIDVTDLEWDAWRRDDGRWTLRLDYASGERRRSAEWTYDHVGRYLVADDDEARWLAGDEDPRDAVVELATRRQVADTSEPDDATPAEEPDDDVHDTLPIKAGRSKARSGDSEADVDRAEETAEETQAKQPAGRKDKRASVPSWDDIVFGSRRKPE